MINGCSDGRYFLETIDYIRRNAAYIDETGRTCDSNPHVYFDHGGAAMLANRSTLAQDWAAARERTITNIETAHTAMGYNILLCLIHGPECKAMCGAGLDINHALDEYATVHDVMTARMPNLEIYTLFHFDKGEIGDDGRQFSIYEFDRLAWSRLREEYPEPEWVAETDPVIAG